MKICSRCKLNLPLTSFVVKRKSRDGLASRCRDCMREIQWLIKYGITPQQYHELLAKQGGVCAVCKGPQISRYKWYSVDHDHESGEVRGLLCSDCNLLLGYAHDDRLILTAAIKYLEGV